LTHQHHTRCNTGLFESREAAPHEKNLPTFQNASQAHARLSGAHENQSGTRGNQRAAGEGESAARSLSERNAPDTEKPARSGERLCGVRRRAHVLRKSTDFENVLRSGCRIVSPNFVLRGTSNRMAYPRLGIIAGRKSAPRAVDRNRAKRLVRAAFHELAPRLGTHDVTIQLRGNLRGDANSALREELHSLLERFIRRSATPPEK
jgi:ribonuclease P protein component